MSEGVRFGGLCPRLVGNHANVPYVRHAVSIEYTRHDDNAFMSLAVGLDYYSPNTWLIVDRILFEHLADGGAAGDGLLDGRGEKGAHGGLGHGGSGWLRFARFRRGR